MKTRTIMWFLAGVNFVDTMAFIVLGHPILFILSLFAVVACVLIAKWIEFREES